MDTDFSTMNISKLIEYIKIQKSNLGDSILIPAHHYQSIEIVQLSDFVGDSYKLAVECRNIEREYIVFCGVRFMAEVASILSNKHQKVLLPNEDSGCPMAEMITAFNAGKVYNKISEICEREVIPVVYINSYVDMKNFCGNKGGAVCTSSNAHKIIQYYFNQNKAVFFSTDYNLGINTARKLKVPPNQIVRIKRDLSFQTCGNIKNAKLFIWDGFCYVHKIFSVNDIIYLREKYPEIKIIVHPECDDAVVDASDISGSTQEIYKAVQKAPKGSAWGVGTEIHFVKRIAQEFSNKTIIPLKESPCIDMEKISLRHLAGSLQSIFEYKEGKGDLKFEVSVPDKYKQGSQKALQMMINIVEGKLSEKYI